MQDISERILNDAETVAVLAAALKCMRQNSEDCDDMVGVLSLKNFMTEIFGWPQETFDDVDNSDLERLGEDILEASRRS